MIASYPKRDECFCSPEYLCQFCKYFFFALCSVAHALNVSVSGDALDFNNYETYLSELIPKDPFYKEHSKSMCMKCRLPLNGHECLPEEFEGFPPCDEGTQDSDGTKSVGELIYLFEMTDFCLGYAFSDNFKTWTDQDKCDIRKKGVWIDEATKLHEVVLQLARISIPLNDLSKAFVAFTRVLYMKPIFKHEVGTTHPINTVLSLKRLFRFLQLMMFRLLPCLVVEKVHRKIKIAKDGMNGIKVDKDWTKLEQKRSVADAAKIRAMCAALQSSAKQSMSAIDEIYNISMHYSQFEAMANLHRFNNSTQLHKYINCYWGRMAVTFSFKDALKSVITACDYAR